MPIRPFLLATLLAPLAIAAAAPIAAEPADVLGPRGREVIEGDAFYDPRDEYVRPGGYVDGERVPGYIFRRADLDGDGRLNAAEERRAKRELLRRERGGKRRWVY